MLRVVMDITIIRGVILAMHLIHILSSNQVRLRQEKVRKESEVSSIRTWKTSDSQDHSRSTWWVVGRKENQWFSGWRIWTAICKAPKEVGHGCWSWAGSRR